MNNLKLFRERAGLTQTELGMRLSPVLKQAAVSNHEVGLRTPDVYQAVEYAKALGVTVEDLFPECERETMPPAA